MDRSRYPADWEVISQQVRQRAGNVCEWCGVPNGAVGVRDARGYFHTVRTPDGRHVNAPAVPVVKLTRIVLTVAHLGAPRPGSRYPWGDPHDKADVRPENLAALCQRCHLGYDHSDHVRHAAETRRRKRMQAGQTPLPV